MPSLFRLDDKVVLVTGGAGLLGGEFLKSCIAAGAKGVSLDMRPSMNTDVTSIMCDITNKEAVKKAFDEIVQRVGIASVLVNAAGRDIRPDVDASENGLFEEYPESSWDAVIDSHLKGTLFVSQEFIKRNRAARVGGSIINISSHYGVVSPDQSLYEYRRTRGEAFFKPVAYSVAKSGVLNFTRWLAEYCAPFNIRVNTLVPGGVENNHEETFVNEYAKRTMLGRMARRDEYNGPILFLASEASSYMTGSTLIVDGGWTAK